MSVQAPLFPFSPSRAGRELLLERSGMEGGGSPGRETEAMNPGQEKWEEEEAGVGGGGGRKLSEEGNVSPSRLWELRGRRGC